MPVSQAEKEFVNYLVEMMRPIGEVSARAMFGGHGIYLDGLMFGLVADGTLYLKVDRESEIEFMERELQPFTYGKNGKEYKMSYMQAPEETLEDSDEMTAWVNKAYNAALRAAAAKRKK